MKEFDRRTFLGTSLKIGGGLVASVVVAELMLPVNRKVKSVVEETSGHPTDNANIKDRIEESCKETTNPQECIRDYKFSIADKVMAAVVAPIPEELTYRVAPSFILSVAEHKEDPFSDALSGTGGFGITRRELLVGAVTSIIFGAVHNVTGKGIDTRTIPVSQTVNGVVWWYLQRKFGIASSILAHAWTNFRIVT